MQILSAAVMSVAALAVNTAETPAPTQSPVPAQTRVPSQAKVFFISPEDWQGQFMCPAGVLESVLATAENQVVTVFLLDQNKKPIADDAWASAAGFRLRRKQETKVRVIMVCGS